MLLKHLTFLLLVRLDTISRLENILAVTEYITLNFEAPVFVLESAPFNNGILKKLLNKKVHYSFQEDQDPILYRTKFLNQMTMNVGTPYITIWDTDVIAPINQVLDAINLLKTGVADFVYPYEKQFLDTSTILRKLYIQDRRIEIFEQNMKKMIEMYSPNPLGGAFLANLNSYKDAGLENENFYGWGLEDGERFYRWANLGYKIKRIPGPLFHLTHERGLNSTFQNPDQQLIKRKEIAQATRKKSVMGKPMKIE